MPKILYVEDDPFISEIYMRKFQASGFEVKNAVTGKEVLRELKSDLYDLMLLDLVIPEMSGIEVLRELKENSDYKGLTTKVVVFSNLSSEEDRKQCLDYGADGFISKTELSPTGVVEEVNRYLHQFEEQGKNASFRQEGKEGIAESRPNKGKKILFIEDEQVFIDMFCRRLKDEGYILVSKQNGAEGLEAATNEEFDLIISDIMMPGLQGHEMIEKLQESEHGRHIPIFLLSASIEEDQFDELVKDGIVHKVFMKTKMTPSKLTQEVNAFFAAAPKES
jgi:CheY-like chemotaxis protein